MPPCSSGGSYPMGKRKERLMVLPRATAGRGFVAPRYSAKAGARKIGSSPMPASSMGAMSSIGLERPPPGCFRKSDVSLCKTVGTIRMDSIS